MNIRVYEYNNRKWASWTVFFAFPGLRSENGENELPGLYFSYFLAWAPKMLKMSFLDRIFRISWPELRNCRKWALWIVSFAFPGLSSENEENEFLDRIFRISWPELRRSELRKWKNVWLLMLLHVQGFRFIHTSGRNVFAYFTHYFCIAHTDNRCTHASCTCVLERVLCRMYTFSHAACTQWSSRTYTHTHTESREFYMHCSTTWSLCMHTNNSWYACASHVHIELHTLHVLHWSACTGIRLHAHIRDLDMYVRIYVHMYICINV